MSIRKNSIPLIIIDKKDFERHDNNLNSYIMEQLERRFEIKEEKETKNDKAWPEDKR